ncbi:predicted protein [Lichtheimia corymbifera JMRC:FSU:9682]|uniref:WKF domain-containing protein n=1 Tax=Lichtheimia corymbifera JMRC:FSU:9682 TaxID=1263082 RepID=A0A068RTV9_9FUNG|nr:predicted protein [Lichtheimia corymbifera JMRC:FSU:9682]
MGSDKAADRSEAKKKHSKKESKKKAAKESIEAIPEESSPKKEKKKSKKSNKEDKDMDKSTSVEKKEDHVTTEKGDQQSSTDDADNVDSTTDNKAKKNKGKKRKAKSQPETTVKRAATSAPDGITYLRQFHSDRESWKFNKVHQTWLLKHMYDLDTIEQSDFDILVEYLKGLKGAARDRTLTQAQDMIPPETTDFDQPEFDAEAALAAVAPQPVAAPTPANEENDTPVVKRARAVAHALSC